MANILTGNSISGQASQESATTFLTSPNQASPINLVGLTAASHYFFLPTGVLSSAVASPLTATYASLLALVPAPVNPGFGIYFTNAGADANPITSLLINYSFGVLTGVAGLSINVYGFYPATFLAAADACIYAFYPIPIAASAAGSTLVPVNLGSAASAVSGALANATVPAIYAVGITATTWPTAGGAFSCEVRALF
jgi:hypothetical protein